VKRKVINVKNYIDPHANGTKGSNYLTLECGHVKRQKGSVKVPEYCRCDECAQQGVQRTAIKPAGKVSLPNKSDDVVVLASYRRR